jgi:hypothetical protein
MIQKCYTLLEYEVTVKKVQNKNVFSKEVVECLHLILFLASQRKVHGHTAKPELNRRITVDWVPLSATASKVCDIGLKKEHWNSIEMLILHP